MVADHRNILKVLKDPHAYRVQRRRPVQRDVRPPDRDDAHGAQRQVDHGVPLGQPREHRPRPRKCRARPRHQIRGEIHKKGIHDAVLKNFGVEMNVPKGYALAANEPDFLWARYEYPTASQGFFIYSYPYEGKVAFARGAARRPQQVRRPHSRPVGRFLHDHLRRLRARFPHVPPGGAPLVRDARVLGRARRFHGRPVRELLDRRHGHQPRLHARLLRLRPRLEQAPQTQLHARRRTPALPRYASPEAPRRRIRESARAAPHETKKPKICSRS